MRPSSLSRAAAFLLAATMVAIGWGSARAETVLLNRGQGAYGLGWLFQQQDGSCRIATPRHVIEANGELLPADVLDRYGRSHATFNPVVATNPDLDLAFLEVRGGLSKEGCSPSRLSAVGVRTALDRMDDTTLAIATPFDRQIIHVERRAVSRDMDGGLIVAIGPRPGAPKLMQGMSGGAVMVDNKPVAMLIEVDTSTGTGVALRFDVIAAELQKLAPPARPSPPSDGKAVIENLMVTHGELATRDGGVSTFLAGSSELVLVPQSERVGLVVSLAEPASIDTVTIAARADDVGQGVLIVEVSSGAAGFVPANRCTITFSGTLHACSFSPRFVDRVRITAPAQSSTLSIGSLEMSRVQP